MAKYFSLEKAKGGNRLYPILLDHMPEEKHPFRRDLAFPLRPLPEWISQDSSLDHISKFFINGEFVDLDTSHNWSA